MKQIRQGVFETNSSSTHTLHISNKELSIDLLDTSLQPDEQGNLIIDGENEFGWEFETYGDAPTKAFYVGLLLFYLRDDYRLYSKRKKDIEEKGGEFQKWVLKNYKTCRQNFVSVLREQVGFKKLQIPSDLPTTKGYIDHQSAESLCDFEFLLDKEKIRSLIFNTKSTIETGNDNS